MDRYEVMTGKMMPLTDGAYRKWGFTGKVVTRSYERLVVCGAKRAGRKISKRAVEERGALSVFNPALAANWDYKKNGGLEPDSPEFRTNQKYWFICKVCGRSYQTRATITRKPVCAECQYKIGRSAKRKVVCVETGAVYKGISAAGRAIGRSAASVSHALKAGTCSGGYHWQYLDE